jgi:1-acyl-sn-glycerol-3-phosphate acyltransferase
LYTFLKYYIKLGLFFYHKKIEVIGLENIPKKGAILFISNHPNALIDPLLIVTNNVRSIHFLSRASAFKNKLMQLVHPTHLLWLLEALLHQHNH